LHFSGYAAQKGRHFMRQNDTLSPMTRDRRLAALSLGALGVVFGDIGTSPLYAFKEAFGGAHPLPLNEVNVFGILSLIFWAVMLIVSVKYLSFVLRFDNKGEGGVLALLALASQLFRKNRRMSAAATVIAVFAASLFYGDAVITPAISVLSAVEGISVATPALERWVVPSTIVIIIGLFALQPYGTGKIGRLFGPVTLIWFCVIGALGVMSIMQTPTVLRSLDPSYALRFALQSPGLAFIALGAVFLALTGGEALYADMGHFGRKPIRIAWFGLVLPALMLNYLGQGALVLRNPAAVKNPFYLLAPPELLLPLVALATIATVIASQATISGAFSVTQQASRLGYLPRVPVTHTSETERGQIYIGRLNWLMLVIVVMLVLGFGSSSHLAAAYGIAVSATMALETALVALVVIAMGGRARILVLGVLLVVFLVEMLFFASNTTKIAAGGWFPILCGLIIFTLLTTWKRGTDVLTAASSLKNVPLKGFCEHLESVMRVPGTAVFFSANTEVVPATLLHNLKHNKVMHERVIFLTMTTEDVPQVDDEERIDVTMLVPQSIYQVVVRYGFMEDPDAMHVLKLLAQRGLRLEIAETTFFLGKSTIARAEHRGLFTWRREVFRWMQRNAPSAAEYFKLPPDRVIELGTQLKL
jgi:KUP system potassium uptake protein